jgi:hypothetical protein
MDGFPRRYRNYLGPREQDYDQIHREVVHAVALGCFANTRVEF